MYVGIYICIYTLYGQCVCIYIYIYIYILWAAYVVTIHRCGDARMICRRQGLPYHSPDSHTHARVMYYCYSCPRTWYALSCSHVFGKYCCAHTNGRILTTYRKYVHTHRPRIYVPTLHVCTLTRKYLPGLHHMIVASYALHAHTW